MSTNWNTNNIIAWKIFTVTVTGQLPETSVNENEKSYYWAQTWLDYYYVTFAFNSEVKHTNIQIQTTLLNLVYSSMKKCQLNVQFVPTYFLESVS